ncbi:MAG: hypothetical protein ACI4OT_03195 [Bacilli bacterium]
MKEATGELNMTVVTIVAIAAILGFFWAMWPNIKNQINQQWSNATEGENGATYEGYIIK